MSARRPCAFCGGAIDYTLPHGSPWSFEVDHSIPVSAAPELALDTSLWRPSHALCNRRGSGGGEVADPAAANGGLGVASEQW